MNSDFYVGIGEHAEWLGSLVDRGTPWILGEDILVFTKEKEYRDAVRRIVDIRPEDGWPWPWTDSYLTEYTYTFIDNKVLVSYFGGDLYDPLGPEPEYVYADIEEDWAKNPDVHKFPKYGGVQCGNV
jgi:hypothetical protein